MEKLRYVFRRPVFPIICKIGEELVSGNTIQQFERRLKKLHLSAEEDFPLVDGTGEGWVLVPKFSAISPLTLDKVSGHQLGVNQLGVRLAYCFIVGVVV